MSLEIKIKNTINNFDDVKSDEFLEILNQIMLEFKTELTIEYLKGKIQKIIELKTEAEKKNQCKLLLPYYDWYLQGL
ncbi:MAG: hypothetical protein O2834_01860 [Crenarchaeota archaeon]|nr:hypothetical protein [Thermoproteota archaeon]HJJ21950.1 hypothetical protein [Nitrosopumilus sp.]MDA0852998.1 hypothetical protein [Thermoproteota archaeon]MDA1122962.1 hypothetical protein [Thermoproteota archaeon]HJJ24945.1 hypothetical protein [Nitrosopumilus sp.]